MLLGCGRGARVEVRVPERIARVRVVDLCGGRVRLRANDDGVGHRVWLSVLVFVLGRQDEGLVATEAIVEWEVRTGVAPKLAAPYEGCEGVQCVCVSA